MRTHVVVILSVESGGNGNEAAEGGEHPAPTPNSISVTSKTYRQVDGRPRKNISLRVCRILGNLIGDVDVPDDRGHPREASATACQIREFS